ncbi:MAG: phosphodiester glycosidase family protein [Ruminococcaceae bacterium]|nr:phosphodiester glycosidase family protein [Oscillospiraceae bacterium]
MKKICTFWLCTCFLVSLILPCYANELSVTVEERTVIEGVTYKHVQQLYENGWQDIYVIQADLSQPYLKFDVLSHEDGKSYLQNTYESAKNADALAAINADFFSKKSGESGRGSAIGLEIQDGVLKTSPAAYESMNALYQTKEGENLYFNPFTYSFIITAPDGTTAPISVMNKYDDMTGIVMYTKDWGDSTPGSAGNVLELVVEKGMVIAKNRDIGPVSIPEDGYVLACDLSMHTFLDDCFQQDDTITLHMTTTPNYEDIETAVGGGGMILVDGQIPTSFSHIIAGTQPRSAVGLDKSGKKMTLVAVDGRRAGATGMTMAQLGYLMADLGCYNAMNLDGGGSTLMAVKQSDNTQQVVNTPSDGGKRPVTNSIGIIAQHLSKAKMSAIRLKSDDTAVFNGASRWLYVEMLDQYGRIMDSAPTDQISWSIIEGSGTMQQDFFYPTAVGKAVIRAEINGFYDEITLQVLDTPHRLTITNDTLALSSGKTATLWLTGRDANGYSASLYPKDVKMTVLNPSVAVVEQNTVKALRHGSTIITASWGEVAANASITVDGAKPVEAPKGAFIPDAAHRYAEVNDTDGFQFTVFGNTRSPEKFFDIYIMNRTVSTIKEESNINFFVGNNVNSGLLTGLGNNMKTADGFSKFTHKGSTFITVKNNYGTTLYGADKTQWTKLQQAIGEVQGGNLFVFLNDHNLSSLDVEITVFKKLMEQAAAKGCTVYVFAGGFVNETLVENGVRYITTAGVFPSIGVKPPATNISYVKYYLVTVNGDQVTYETKGIVK